MGMECEGNAINIFAITFPVPSLYFPFSVFMHVRKHDEDGDRVEE